MKLPKIKLKLPAVKLGSTIFVLIIPLGILVGYFFSNIKGFVTSGSKGVLTPINKLFYVAKVNGVGISKGEWKKKLESRYGKPAVSELINYYMVRGELKRAGITVSKEEINAEIATIEKQLAGQSLEEVLKQEGMTLSDLRDVMYNQVGVRKLLSGKVVIADADVDAYIASAGATLEGTTDAQKRASAKKALVDQKLSEEINKWFTDLQGKIKVENYLE